MSMHPEIMLIDEAAEWLRISPQTLRNWISMRRFTAADGLRRINHEPRIHFETMKERFHAGTLMVESKTNPPAPRKPYVSRKAAEADRRTELCESLRDVEVDAPEPEFPVH